MNIQDYTDFLSRVIGEICDFAVDCGVKPDAMLKIITQNISDLLLISTYNGWKRREDE